MRCVATKTNINTNMIRTLLFFIIIIIHIISINPISGIKYVNLWLWVFYSFIHLSFIHSFISILFMLSSSASDPTIGDWCLVVNAKRIISALAWNVIRRDFLAFAFLCGNPFIVPGSPWASSATYTHWHSFFMCARMVIVMYEGKCENVKSPSSLLRWYERIVFLLCFQDKHLENFSFISFFFKWKWYKNNLKQNQDVQNNWKFVIMGNLFYLI